ncbi:hypothetical protein GCM10010915_14400 [Microbacterium faecale]|uniref:DUF1700 domain-containing protein n=1 Tax=Microbacterium faecale TaxID=1804630 RepID=A0A916Y9A1_9MICO|nr:hypothetical protein [Microbacterium faecale]GGD35098.1 hypothetical protein GCM10010915_14400 [Microbacterium faecale]
MNAIQDRAANRFLTQLDRELGILPAAQRHGIGEDVESHILDALERGRDIDAILAGLGTPREVARQYADQLGVDQGARPDDRATRWLAIATVAVGALSAALMPFIADGELGRGAVALGVEVLLFALPILLGALPLVVLRPWGYLAAVVAAIVTTGFVAVGLGWQGNLIMFMPLMFVTWAAVIVPPVARRGASGARITLRILGGCLVAFPGLFGVAGGIGGTVDLTVAVVIIGIVTLAAGALFACGVRAGYVIVALGGVVVLVTSLFDPGLLFLVFWSTGGLWIALGVGALAGARRR